MGAIELNPQTIQKKLDDIPSLPAIVYELSKVINDPMSSTKDVESLMSQDIGLTTKVLKLANSAFYAIPGGVANISRAISFIGFDTIHQLVLSASIIQSLESTGSPAFNVSAFWKHSIGTAIASETIAKHLKLQNAGDYFTSGLIHDIGKIALFIVEPNALDEIIKYTAIKKVTFTEAEKALGYLGHCEISRILGEKWRLPKSMQSAALYHHEKDVALRKGLSSELNRTVDIVYLSNLLTHALKFGQSGHDIVIGAPTEILSRLMIDPQKDMPILIRDIKAGLEKSNGFIQTIVGTV